MRILYSHLLERINLQRQLNGARATRSGMSSNTKGGRQMTSPVGVSVEFTDVKHSFVSDGHIARVLDGLNVTIAPGEFVSIVGPSGCGKTTLLTMACGLVSPRGGTVRIGGRELGDAVPPEVAYMLARDALMPWRSAVENVEFGLEIRGVEAAERRHRASLWLERVGLRNYAGARVNQLSQGMRQRVAIARTLALSPKVVLMDEPFAALDAQTRLLLHDEFLKLWQETGATVLFVTHDLAEAIKLSDRVVLLGGSPANVAVDMTVNFPRPRPRDLEHGNPVFREYFTKLSDELEKVASLTLARDVQVQELD